MDSLKTEFENKLTEYGFSYQGHTDDFYIICQNNDGARNINAQLIKSEPIDTVIHGSRNGNKIQSIGFFRFKISPTENETGIFVLGFQNTNNHSVDFIIVPQNELKRRLHTDNRMPSKNNKVSLLFWLMPDGCIYDATNLGVEGEWYYLNKGRNGRMFDCTDRDYSGYLNNWDRLKMI